MAYKKVKLLSESGEELYPECDWSVVKNSPITVDPYSIDIQNEDGSIIFSWGKDGFIDAGPLGVNVSADAVDFHGDKIHKEDGVYIANENTENQPILFDEYPREEKAFKDFPLNKFFGSLISQDASIKRTDPIVAIAQVNPGKGTTYRYYIVGAHDSDWKGEDEADVIWMNKKTKEGK